MTPKQKRLETLHKELKKQETRGNMWDLVLYVILGAGIIKLVLFALDKFL